MSSSLVVPTSLRGWLVLAASVAVFAAGIWPVIALVNQARLVLGLPALVAWSYLILVGCTLTMLLGNRLLHRRQDEAGEQAGNGEKGARVGKVGKGGGSDE
ncbi:hypothetical protein [Halomonas sp. DN3]|uniref:hypothetical protein n=1 Tax=Halomonas sp. DN3 TaxID=2953657 RepID=UPI0020A0FF35|nr:hypothetical protein [Halomonas sp. DN3]USZ50173.1 hypothetical protein NKF27_01230 [Halomonas sp. DN3]